MIISTVFSYGHANKVFKLSKLKLYLNRKIFIFCVQICPQIKSLFFHGFVSWIVVVVVSCIAVFLGFDVFLETFVYLTYSATVAHCFHCDKIVAEIVKGKVHPKTKIQSFSTHPHVDGKLGEVL